MPTDLSDRRRRPICRVDRPAPEWQEERASPPAQVDSGFASWFLGRPLSLMLGLVALGQLATWLPHYLTWPYWADHDVFAHAARAWDRGELPYRDVRLNNFPGTIYLFYLLGKTLGWGRPWTFYALDATLLLGFLGILLAWSRKLFGRVLPGLVGSLALLGYYLSLDYSHAAQRDWQGPALAMMGLLVAQAWRGRGAWVAPAILAAFAFAIRPQVVLFLPALILAIATQGDGISKGQAFRRGAAWLATFAGFVALAFLPLVVEGIVGDFLRSLRAVAFGSTYNKVTLVSFATNWWAQASIFRWLAVPLGILLLGHGTALARVAWSGLLAFAGASIYKPLSPMAHSYLDIPLVVGWSVNLAILAGLVVSSTDFPARIKLLGLVTLLGLSITTLVPKSCRVGPSLGSPGTLRSHLEPSEAPVGYRHGPVQTAAFYPWDEYRAALDYLRSHTKPSTKVANALKGDPAIVSEVDRPSAFPAESITWLKMVNRRDEPAFVESLERAKDSVALWSPNSFGPDPRFQIPQIEAIIRRLYQLEAKFGSIEVWRRAGGS